MYRLKNFLHGLRVRTLKIDILTLFISLTIITFGCVIFYSYFKNYHAIVQFSKGTMERNSSVIINRISHIQDEAELVLENTSGLFIDSKNISVNDPQLQLFMLNVLKYNPDITSFFLAFQSGERILVKNIDSSTQTHFISMTDKPLPANAMYLIKLIDLKRKPNPEVWYYADAGFNVVGSEEFAQLTITVQNRPWFTGAMQAHKIYWTEVYNYIHTDEPGLTVSKPIYTKNGELVGILGADISFVGLSNFLKKQTIGKSGRVFIADQNEIILAPNLKELDQSKISSPVVQAAVNYFKKTQDHNFSFKVDNVRYLTYVSDLPAIFGKHWVILTIVPFSDFFSDLIKTQLEVALITLLTLAISIVIIIYFSKRISHPIVKLAKEIDKITNLNLSSETRVSSYIVEIRMMDNSVAALRTAMRSFSRYVPKEIVRQLLAKGQEISLSMEKKKLTIFFCDIQDFSTIVETHSLQTLLKQLNKYFDALSKIILRNYGTIDKYIGDSIMAIWGAPVENPQHSIFACTAALRCQAFLVKFNQECREKGNPEFITRFGISSGAVVVGNIGTLERMNYTVIGDAVNIAARLQVTDKIYHVGIIISEEVYVQTQGRFLVRPLDTVTVKGKKTKIKIYELVALLGPDPEIGATTQQKELCAQFSKAYQQFVDGDYKAANKSFAEIHQKFPDDYPTEFYLNRLHNL